MKWGTILTSNKNKNDNAVGETEIRLVIQDEFKLLTNFNMNVDNIQQQDQVKVKIEDCIETHGTQSDIDDVKLSSDFGPVVDSDNITESVKLECLQEPVDNFGDEQIGIDSDDLDDSNDDPEISGNVSSNDFKIVAIKHGPDTDDDISDTSVENANDRNMYSEPPISANCETRTKLHECDICLKCFAKSSGLKRHELIHSKMKPHKCDICKKYFSQACHLKTHKLLHSGLKPHQCDVCQKRFTVNWSLKMHMLTHTGVKSCKSQKFHKCDICDKCFTRSYDLNRHKISHSGLKQYQCDACGICFTQSGHLNAHRLTHTGEKSHQCDICQKYFSTVGHLKKHKLLHHGIKPHCCEICMKCFARAHDLNKHKLTHSDIKPYQCVLCEKKFKSKQGLKIHGRGCHNDSSKFDNPSEIPPI